MYLRIGPIEQKCLNLIKEKGKVDIKLITTTFNMERSIAQRKIDALSRKQLIKHEKGFLTLKTTTVINLKRKKDFELFFDELSESGCFLVSGNKIILSAEFKFFHVLDLALNNNETLNKLKETNPSRHAGIICSNSEQLFCLIKQLRRKIECWSEGIYSIYITEKQTINMVYINTENVVSIEKSSKGISFCNKKILIECVYQFKNALKQLSEKIMDLAYLDYSNV